MRRTASDLRREWLKNPVALADIASATGCRPSFVAKILAGVAGEDADRKAVWEKVKHEGKGEHLQKRRDGRDDSH